MDTVKSFFSGRKKWIVFVLAALVVVTAGLVLGERESAGPIAGMYVRQDFTLMDDSSNLFHLHDIPDGELLLMIFTPDGLHPTLVKPFAEFSASVKALKADGVETVLVSRTNREIVHNFKHATRFPGKSLEDPSGSVGRLFGFWQTIQYVDQWAYVLTDNKMHRYWLYTSDKILSARELAEQVRKHKKSGT